MRFKHGVSLSWFVHTKKLDERNRRKRKAFDKRYKRECGECTSYFATPEEIEKTNRKQ